MLLCVLTNCNLNKNYKNGERQCYLLKFEITYEMLKRISSQTVKCYSVGAPGQLSWLVSDFWVLLGP